MSEKRKKALVAYLAALFGIAFLVVTVSLVIQMNKQGSADTTSAERVIALQTQLQVLEAENDQLRADLQEAQTNILEIQEGTEFLESVAYDATAHIDYLEHRLQAVICLSTAQQALADGDQDALAEALGMLVEYEAFLNPQSYEIYQNILGQYMYPTE